MALAHACKHEKLVHKRKAEKQKKIMLAALAAVVVGVAFKEDSFLNAEVYTKPLLKAHSRVSFQQTDSKEAGPARPQVLVLVGDHGTGSSNFGQTLKAHPCVIDVGEPFGASQMIWSKSAPSAVCGPKHLDSPAIFDADSGTMLNAKNPKLALNLAKYIPGVDTSPLYHNLDYNIADYFVRIRDLVCKGVAEDVCPPADCTISIKMFPAYINGVTAGQHNIDEVPSACTIAQNEKAMDAWKLAMEAFQKNPKTATFTLNRDEMHRQFSMFHRSDAAGTEFDCSLPREKTTFASVSEAYTDIQLQIESCWANPAKCLNASLSLVGLSTEPMGAAGKQFAPDLAHPTSMSCSTNPLATFKLLGQGMDVRLSHPGDGPVKTKMNNIHQEENDEEQRN
jgi:hypothetical protein